MLNIYENMMLTLSQEFHKNEDVGREREVSVQEQEQVIIT